MKNKECMDAFKYEDEITDLSKEAHLINLKQKEHFIIVQLKKICIKSYNVP